MNSERFQRDEEVEADFWARENSQRDNTRNREPVRALGSPTIVAHWKCRRQACRNLVEITETGAEAWLTFNKLLAKKGEPPLDTATIVFCAECDKEYRANEAERAHKRMARIAEVSERLRNETRPNEMRDLAKQLDSLGYSDTGALVAAIKERRLNKDTKRPRGGV